MAKKKDKSSGGKDKGGHASKWEELLLAALAQQIVEECEGTPCMQMYKSKGIVAVVGVGDEPCDRIMEFYMEERGE